MKTIFRNFYTTLRRFKLASTLNILGLSVAFAAFLIIIIQVRYEYSYDTVYAGAERIYRAEVVGDDGGNAIVPQTFVDTYGPMSPLVESFTMVMPPYTDEYVTIENAGQRVGFVEKAYRVYPGFADVFSPVMVEGSAATLAEPTKVLIPSSMAERFFGKSTGVVGSKISIASPLSQNSKIADFEIGGVYMDWPSNAQMGNYVLIPKAPRVQTTWDASNFFMFVKLRDGATPDAVTAEWKRGFDFAKQTDWQTDTHICLTPITDLYYDQRPNMFGGESTNKGNRTTTDILLAIALLVIVVAAINFVNFSTSLAPMRIKSINTQKVLGSLNWILRTALVVEAVGIALIACGLGIAIVDVLSATGFKDITISGIELAGNGTLIGLTIGVAVVMGLLSGLYPAFYTTKVPPVMALKGGFAMSPKGRALRTALIGFQFIISIGLIIGSIFLQLQNSYLRHINTGIDMEQTAIASIGGELLKSTGFESALRSSPQVTGVGFACFPIGTGDMQQGWGKRINDVDRSFNAMVVSWQVPEILGVKLVDGSSFTPDDKNKEYNTYIFNQTAAGQFGGLKAGDRIPEWSNSDTIPYSEIRAITADFNYQSLHSGILPAAFVVEGTKTWQSSKSILYVGIKGDPYAAVEHIKRVAAEIDPAYPLEIEFYDTAFNAMYQKDQKAAGLITLFSMLAIIISLVGVFGLVVFETQYRRREIGLRKIYGSTITQVLTMFNRKFVWIVGVCFLVAAPAAYFGVTMWLESFAYRTPLYWWVFAVALAIVMTITLITVTVQSYRAATENPIKSLKSE